MYYCRGLIEEFNPELNPKTQSKSIHTSDPDLTSCVRTEGWPCADDVPTCAEPCMGPIAPPVPLSPTIQPHTAHHDPTVTPPRPTTLASLCPPPPPPAPQHARKTASRVHTAMPRALPPVSSAVPPASSAVPPASSAISPASSADATPGPRRPALSASVVESVAGFSAGVVSCLAAHPLDLLKNRLQLNTASRSRAGDSFRILRNVVRDEGGIAALYRGLWPNLLGNSLGWGLYFLFYGNLKDLLQRRKPAGEHLGSAEFFGASIVAGLSTGFCTNPIWVVKTRMLEKGANHPAAYPTMRAGLAHVYTTRGVQGLWAGFVPSSLGVLHGAVQFALYESLKKRRGAQLGGQENLSNWEYMYMSGGSKLLAGAITYPYQPIRARMQQYEAASRYSGLADVLRKTYKNEGFLAFYKG